MKTKLILGGIVIVMIVGIFYYQEHKLTKLQSNIVTLEQNNTSLQTAVNIQAKALQSARASIQNVIALNNSLQARVNAISAQQDATLSKLSAYEGRLTNVAIKDPESVGSRATAATNDLLRRFYEAARSRNY